MMQSFNTETCASVKSELLGAAANQRRHRKIVTFVGTPSRRIEISMNITPNGAAWRFLRLSRVESPGEQQERGLLLVEGGSGNRARARTEPLD